MKNSAYNDLLISTQEAQKVLLDLYGIQGKAQRLPGEYDMNFRISSKGGPRYILKISRPDADLDSLYFQQQLLDHLKQCHKDLVAPETFTDLSGNSISFYSDHNKNQRAVRLLSWIPGRIYSEVHPKRSNLRQSLGLYCGRLTSALEDFEHPSAHRTFEWDLSNSLWTTDHIEIFESKEQIIIEYFQKRFKSFQKEYKKLPKSVIHNDANDFNILVDENLKDPELTAVIDYGDAIHSQTINDLAVCCAYGIMNLTDPLSGAIEIVKGYHQGRALQEKELSFLYDCIAMRLVITLTKSRINQIKEPDNEYLQISSRPAWELLLLWKEISPEFAHYSFRQACGFTAHPNENKFKKWSLGNKSELRNLFPTVPADDCYDIDLSVSSTWLGHLSDFSDFDYFDYKINKLQKQHPKKIIAGGYLEPRLVYTTEAYQKKGNDRNESRTIHLGIDFWLGPGTPVHTLFDGEVVVAVNDSGDKEYGGLVILKHLAEDFEFYSLYGHLSVKSATSLKPGEILKSGDQVGTLGNYPENGNWPPHLHFEIMLSLLNFRSDFPGVAYDSEILTWKSICPDPNLLFQLESLGPYQSENKQDLIKFRQKFLGKGMSLSYEEPLHIVRGMGPYLIDQKGVMYLDTVNNVAHTGHEHPVVVKAGQEQMSLLNTNTRYLHKNIIKATETLLSTFPPELSVVHFVNSGSEANELALRMAKTVTGQNDIIASEMGYHGNTNACIEISSYKFDGKGGAGCPEHTHIFPIPDKFRGKYRGENTGKKYALEIKRVISKLSAEGKSPAAFIIEPIISCGGQIELPVDFLKHTYESIRKAGGVCISDEVQVGCGRVGSSFWGFELYDVVPDIVTIGKPLGNGHPVAAVVCTREVADKFANGMEYFNTFGGNPVSCAIANAVVQLVKNENLQKNALRTGNYLKEELKQLSLSYPILKDIRGQGLFLGIELTDKNLKPLPDKTKYLANRMKDKGILMSIDGPDHNVLKIKPPMVFSLENSKSLLKALSEVLDEDYMKI
ncbi:aminotransferase class III-fold pyridoxal phosphate-dependent enzyme [Lutimonas saemankumensis]|uniref:aminotransferase class III-fold pyridoxal phosphate-dependent enzyme n=1 Tax=Lutimonas saemankumensis TaxID=483016 RepID=UPI001CD50BFE|nr:aminotransferase class III-fold pyridoxal phosphate-dependent enzyme [Lutimonas saemankumensis]MCA0933391.1 aminotransferase class III-fold pyridoxal phosphate-dependent enzyme [Lutimonas saemankumensis]